MPEIGGASKIDRTNSLLCWFALIFVFFSVCIKIVEANSPKLINIGVVTDGPMEREMLPFGQIKDEIIALNKGEFDIRFPKSKIIHGNWTLKGVTTAIEKLVADDSIDLIIANGLFASHQAARIKPMSKPVIAPIVADRILQKFPYVDGKSGKHNFVYINDNRSVEDDLRRFYQLKAFNYLAIPANRSILEALPEITKTTSQVQQELGFRLSFVPFRANPEEIISQLPDDVDAVYLPPLLRFSPEEIKALAEHLIDRKIPSFSMIGLDYLHLGFMATMSGRDLDFLRYARRIALNVQSILLGTDAATLKVNFDQPAKLAINLRTARAIGFSPTWKDLEEAELLYDEPAAALPAIRLTDAIRQAVAANLNLQSDAINPEIAANQVDAARSNLLPQLNLGANFNIVDDKSTAFQQAERSGDSQLTLSQLVYSERLWSNFDVSRFLKEVEDFTFRSRMLDVMRDSAVAYLQLLSTKAQEKIRESNLRVTSTNLELARSRLDVGYSNRSDLLRWESEIASDRSSVYQAKANRELAETELKRQLNIPLGDTVKVTDAGIEELLDLLDSDRFRRFFNNPHNFEIYTRFEVQRALDNAPELSQADRLIASNQRQLDAAKRIYYIPDINVNLRYNQNLYRGGAGATNPNLLDDDWSANVQATLPLFIGGARQAEVSRASNSLNQSRIQWKEIHQRIEARLRAAMQRAKGSYPAIRLSRSAAKAATENYQFVSDAYAKGAVSITNLIDAQDAALAADLAAVNAQYTFFIDWVEIQRAIANFDLLIEANGFDKWYDALDDYYKTYQQQK